MTITRGKGKLGRLCKRCDERFVPTGKSTKICEKCSHNGSSFINQLARKQKQMEKKKCK